LQIGEGQTISQPYIVALMIEAAEVKPGDNVLEVGAGSGYAAAVMGRIADRVYAIERHPSLGKSARQRFKKLGYDNIELRVGDGTRGWPQAAPFDAILVAAGGPDVPPALKDQLAIVARGGSPRRAAGSRGGPRGRAGRASRPARGLPGLLGPCRHGEMRLGLASLSFFGSIAQSTVLLERFVRFHQLISVEFGYFPTAWLLKAIVDGTRKNASLIYVIVGGGSVFNSVGQHESLVWTRLLQQHLGPRFRFINFAQRAGSSTDFGSVAAELLLLGSQRVIFVGDASSRRYANPLDKSRYRHMLFEAYQRGFLLRWPPRDALLSGAPFSGPDELRTPALRALLDAYLNFNDLWNLATYELASLNWHPLLGEISFHPRSSFEDAGLTPEQYAPLRYRADLDRVMRNERDVLTISPDDPFWTRAADLAGQMVPPRLREVSIAVILVTSPYYRQRLTAAEQEASLAIARHNAAMLAGLGFRRTLLPTLEFSEDDYVDRIHLSVSGGQKLAAKLAPVIEDVAADLGYLR
jgi:SAM-dependent methyltransferase